MHRLLLALLLLVCDVAHGHRLSHSEAWALFYADGSWELDLFLEPADLPGQALETVAPWAHDQLVPRFDDAPAAFDVSLPRDAGRGRLVTVRLSGEVPPGAGTFAWQSDEDVGTVVLNLRQEGVEQVLIHRVDPGDRSPDWPLLVAPPPQGAGSVVATYIGLGFTHILPKGLDHVLFVLGLFLACRSTAPLLAQITAFTAAHTLTLGLSTAGWVQLPPSVVEPLIALSIAWVAIENAVGGRVGRFRVALVFAFGLLHGLGFAGVLSELGLPRDRFLTALLGFNVGVELGQLAVVALALAAVGRLRGAPWYHRRVVLPASLVIGGLGLFWTVERLFVT